MKMTLICMKMKLHTELIFIWNVSHLNSFWNRGTRELENGLFWSEIIPVIWNRALVRLSNHGAVLRKTPISKKTWNSSFNKNNEFGGTGNPCFLAFPKQGGPIMLWKEFLKKKTYIYLRFVLSVLLAKSKYWYCVCFSRYYRILL